MRVKRNLPSCRLTIRKWYIHAHQVRIDTIKNGKSISRRLRTNRLVTLLRSTFGRAYYPRYNNRSSPHHHQSKALRTEQKPKPRKLQVHTATTFMPTSTLNKQFPLPIQAQPPWLNPAYYSGQLPYNGLVQVPNNVLAPGEATMQPQPTQLWATHQVKKYGSSEEQRAPKEQH